MNIHTYTVILTLIFAILKIHWYIRYNNNKECYAEVKNVQRLVKHDSG